MSAQYPARQKIVDIPRTDQVNGNGHAWPASALNWSGQPQTAPEPEKRCRGRPKGSRNRFSGNARALIAQYGLGAVKTLCKIAAGQTVYSAPDASGKRERIVPSVDQRIKAAEAILARLAPALKSSDVKADVSTSSSDPLTDFLLNSGDTPEEQRAREIIRKRIERTADRIVVSESDRDL